MSDKKIVYVTAEAIEAQDRSIEEYERKILIPNGEKVKVGPSVCENCQKFNIKGSRCVGCAISADGCEGCENTPYTAIEAYCPVNTMPMTPELRTLLGAELDYLRDLRKRSNQRDIVRAASCKINLDTVGWIA